MLLDDLVYYLYAVHNNSVMDSALKRNALPVHRSPGLCTLISLRHAPPFLVSDMPSIILIQTTVLNTVETQAIPRCACNVPSICNLPSLQHHDNSDKLATPCQFGVEVEKGTRFQTAVLLGRR